MFSTSTKCIRVCGVGAIFLAGFFLWSATVLNSNPTSSQPHTEAKTERTRRPDGEWPELHNSYYHYAVQVPPGTNVCHSIREGRGEDCETRIFEDQEVGKNDTIQAILPPLGGLEIRAVPNSTTLSAVVYGQRSLALNRRYNPDARYRGEKRLKFAGKDSFQFVAVKQFEERGGAINEAETLVNEPQFFQEASEDRRFSEPHRVIYFDHQGFMFRIIFPEKNTTTERLVRSLKLE